MTSIPASPRRRTDTSLRHWSIWTASFLAFPVAGLAGSAVAGPADGALAALLGGSVAGLVIGVTQVLASSGRLDPRRWILATTVGMGAGLALGAANAEYGTTLQYVALMGLVSGMVLGTAQTFALPPRTRLRWLWAVAVTGLWPLGWAVSTIGEDRLSEHLTIFALPGALVFTALSGLVLDRLIEGPDQPAPRGPALLANTPS